MIKCFPLFEGFVSVTCVIVMTISEWKSTHNCKLLKEHKFPKFQILYNGIEK